MNPAHAIELLESRCLLSAAAESVWPGAGHEEEAVHVMPAERVGPRAEAVTAVPSVAGVQWTGKPIKAPPSAGKRAGKPKAAPSHFAVKFGPGVHPGPYPTVVRPSVGSPAPQGSALHLTNASFESFPDFAGWDTAGNASVRSDDFLAPPDGSVQAVLSTVAAVSAGGEPADAFSLETFLGLTAGSLGEQGAGLAVNGTAIRQVLSGRAGDTLTLTYDFLTNETAAGAAGAPGVVGTDDFAFVTLSGNGQARVVKLSDAKDAGLSATSVADQSATGLDRETGRRTYTLTLPADGAYTLGLGVVNVGDSLGNSTLAVDGL